MENANKEFFKTFVSDQRERGDIRQHYANWFSFLRFFIEPKEGTKKQDPRLSCNFYRRIKGDNINVLLAAATMNLKRRMNN